MDTLSVHHMALGKKWNHVFIFEMKIDKDDSAQAHPVDINVKIK